MHYLIHDVEVPSTVLTLEPPHVFRLLVHLLCMQCLPYPVNSKLHFWALAPPCAFVQSECSTVYWVCSTVPILDFFGLPVWGFMSYRPSTINFHVSRCALGVPKGEPNDGRWQTESMKAVPCSTAFLWASVLSEYPPKSNNARGCTSSPPQSCRIDKTHRRANPRWVCFIAALAQIFSPPTAAAALRVHASMNACLTTMRFTLMNTSSFATFGTTAIRLLLDLSLNETACVTPIMRKPHSPISLQLVS